MQLPTFVARMLAFKLSIDTSKLPAVGDLLRSMARCASRGRCWHSGRRPDCGQLLRHHLSSTVGFTA